MDQERPAGASAPFGPVPGDKLQGLLPAVMSIAEELSLEEVLRRIVQSACQLLEARYGAIGVIADGGGLSHFVIEGIDPELAALIGPLPAGHGVLGLLISDPRPLRLPNIADHPASYGFPPNHPPMHTFLGVPIRIRDVVFGNLYLTEKEGGGLFTADDEELAVALAEAAGFAIENAKMYTEAQLRAQWLEAGRSVAVCMMETVRDNSFPGQAFVAQTALATSESAVAFIVGRPNESGQAGITTVAGEGFADWAGRLLDLEPEAVRTILDSGKAASFEAAPALLGPALGSVSGPALLARLGTGGAEQGLLLLVRGKDAPEFSAVDRDMAAVFCAQAALALELAQARRNREQLVLYADRDRIAQDLHDVVIQRLFAAGLNVQSLGRFTNDPAGIARIRAITNELDATIKDLRDTIYSLRTSVGETDLLSSRILNAVRKVSRALPFAPRIALSGPIDSAVPPELAKQVIAVVSEGVSNAVRHANAAEIEITVTAEADALSVTVRDDGCGAGNPALRSGLANMEDRAMDLKGVFKVESVAGHGTSFYWSVPLPSLSDAAVP